MPTYIQKRRRKFYAVLEIPRPLRPIVGKPRFVKSLETDSLTEAQRRVGPIVAGWLGQLERARKSTGAQGDAAFFRRALREAVSMEQRAEIMERIDARADEIGAINVEHVGQSPSSDPVARQFYDEATGAAERTLEHLDAWLASANFVSKTTAMHRSDAARFAVTFPLLRDVDKTGIRKWVAALQTGDGIKVGLAPKSVQRIVSGLRSYWRYMQSAEVLAGDNRPFDNLDLGHHAKRNKNGAVLRQPFQPADVPRLVQGALARGDGELADLIRLGMWTGCRIEELCGLKIMDVDLAGSSFRVVAAKSDAGVREVPIHAELQPVMTRLIGKRSTGYVLEGLTLSKHGDRSNALGKRFGKLRTVMGFGPAFVFHSIRRTVVTLLENAGVSENVTADLVGHEKPRITYGLYSGGATLQVKRAALALLSYPSVS